MSMLYSQINSYCQQLEQEFEQIPEERKARLHQLATYLKEKYIEGAVPKLIVICTHNSRRSHIGQLWLAKSADYYNLPAIATFSGGTEATAFNPRAVAALKKAGFAVGIRPHPSNPTYLIKWKCEMTPYQAFSKKYDDAPNPSNNFAAILVCTSADEGCPVIPGTDFRFFLPYEDPKKFDDTEKEAEIYEERVRQIGREMMYLAKKVKYEV